MQSFGYPLDKAETIKNLWEASFNSNIAKFIGAVENGKLIGAVGLFLFESVATVGYMGVLPDYRNKGVGKAIFKAVMEKIKSLNYEAIGYTLLN